MHSLDEKIAFLIYTIYKYFAGAINFLDIIVSYSLFLRMNTASLRKTNAPLTPNLEDYKQKNKSKSKRKPTSIPPTNPPTPKPFKGQITIKPNM